MWLARNVGFRLQNAPEAIRLRGVAILNRYIGVKLSLAAVITDEFASRQTFAHHEL
jgi:hypothetical protein